MTAGGAATAFAAPTRTNGVVQVIAGAIAGTAIAPTVSHTNPVPMTAGGAATAIAV